MPCLHARCLFFDSNRAPSTLLAATRHSFPSCAAADARRRERIPRLLVPKLAQMVPFPNELLFMVARELVRECAVVTNQQQMLEPLTRDFVVDLSRDVYAQYIRVDGLRYVQSLGNSKPEESCGEWQCLYDAGKRSITTAIVAEDPLGIRLVRFMSPSEPSRPAPIHGAWWREVPNLDKNTSLKGETDVIRSTPPPPPPFVPLSPIFLLPLRPAREHL